MKELVVTNLRGKKFFIDNIGKCFMVTDESMLVANYFSVLKEAIEFCINN